MIRKIIKRLRLVLLHFNLMLSSELSHRWQIFVWVASDLVVPILFATVWSVVAQNPSRRFTGEEMVTYYFLVTFVGKFTFDWSHVYISRKIQHGEFARQLLIPRHYIYEALGVNLATKAIRFFMILPFLLVAYFLIGEKVQVDLSLINVILFVTSLVLGFSISFVVGNIFALATFYDKQIAGLRAIYLNILAVFSGEYVPLKTLSNNISKFVEILPFRYILSFPIRVLMGDLSSREVFSSFIGGLFWLISLIIIYLCFYKKAIKKFEGEGL